MSGSGQHNSEVIRDHKSWLDPPTCWGTGGGGGVTSWDATHASWDEDPATHDTTFNWSTEAGKIYSKDMCLEALRGEKIPAAATDGDICSLSHVIKLCILCGIRRNHGFGTELRHHAGPEYASFRRALNARAIISNVIPDMDVVNDPSSVPYCIWYPQVASEDTYRELVMRYPLIRYHVGRACAVAGDNRLYKELHLLPDISIAEEARDSVMRSQRGDNGVPGAHVGNPNGSADILQQIIQQPVRFHVMNDYERTVELENPLPATYGLNGDTAVVSTLQLERSFELVRGGWNRFYNDYSRLKAPSQIDGELAPCYFNITEGWNIGEYTFTEDGNDDDDDGGGGGLGAAKRRPQSEVTLELLWNPLPFDLPWGDKDLLILMAAYYGDIDRYARLRRPQHVSQAERGCLVRGIYHSTAFARWCSIHLSGDQANYNHLRSAITARFIISNDLSHIADNSNNNNNSDNEVEEEEDDYLPTQIWYPTVAAPATYRELALRKPAKMMAPVARALIIADYRDVWDELVDRIQPFAELVSEASVSPNGAYYLDSLRQSCAKRGVDFDTAAGVQRYPDLLGVGATRGGVFAEISCDMELRRSPRVDDVQWDTQDNMYDGGGGVNVSRVELFIAAPKKARPSEQFDRVDLEHLYRERRAGGEESWASRRRGEWGPRRGRGYTRGG